MNQRGNIKGIIKTACLSVGYLFFVLVQLNFHFKGVPETISYFSSDYSLAKPDAVSAAGAQHVFHKARGTDAKKISCRLNKRFYPEYFLIVSQTEPAVSASRYVEQIFTSRRIDPCSDLHFTAHGLRGPPSIV